MRPGVRMDVNIPSPGTNVRQAPAVPGRSPALRVAIGAGLAVFLSSSLHPSPAVAQEPPPGPEGRLHALVNAHREGRAGCPPLRWHAPSAAVAEARSVDMLARRYFDHVTPEGRTVFDELGGAGIEAWGRMAENIALTQAGAASALELWRDSGPHRRNLDTCSFTHHGIGERGGVWTQILLAQPKPLSPAAPPADSSPPPAPATPLR